ncbi:hypothetical protein GCM10023166_31740 [Paeniglutamicibacter cryotolerans]
MHWISIRDQICATPGCQNRVRHIDHIDQWFHGGATTAHNASARCAWCNQSKEYPGWSERPLSGSRHGLEITTPTGKVYRSTSPPLSGTRATTRTEPPARPRGAASGSRLRRQEHLHVPRRMNDPVILPRERQRLPR